MSGQNKLSSNKQILSGNSRSGKLSYWSKWDHVLGCQSCFGWFRFYYKNACKDANIVELNINIKYNTDGHFTVKATEFWIQIGYWLIYSIGI